MMHLLVIFLAAAFTENILLARFLGMCSFLAISRQMKTSVGLGFAVVFVTTFTAAVGGAARRLSPPGRPGS